MFSVRAFSLRHFQRLRVLTQEPKHKMKRCVLEKFNNLARADCHHTHTHQIRTVYSMERNLTRAATIDSTARRKLQRDYFLNSKRQARLKDRDNSEV